MISKKLSDFFSNEPAILCFSIIVTEKCNINCSYCHFYGMRGNKKNRIIGKEIDKDIFKTYISFIKKIKTLLPKNIELQYRFSGGEPLTMGDKLFEISDYGYSKLKYPPYILTNGLAITKKWIEKAKKHHIKSLVVSLENPYNPDFGAIKPHRIVRKIKLYNSSKMPIIPGVTIVRNRNFKQLYSICNYFYKMIGTIPTISELNFHAFEIPSRKEHKELYREVLRIVKRFHNKTQLVLFPYISPELSYGGKKQYLIELDINNDRYKLDKGNINEKIDTFIQQINEESYPKSNCNKKKCDWFCFCRNYKWVWKETFNKMSLKEKHESYCRLKKIINQAFYDAVKNIKV